MSCVASVIALIDSIRTLRRAAVEPRSDASCTITPCCATREAHVAPGSSVTRQRSCQMREGRGAVVAGRTSERIGVALWRGGETMQMDLRLGAAVRGLGGEHVGTLKRVLVDEQGEVEEIVVRLDG